MEGPRYGKEEPENKPVDTTTVLFTSIILIILTFFIMMTAKANFDETRYGKVVTSVYETFGMFDGGYSIIGSDSGLAIDMASIGDPMHRLDVQDSEMARIRALLAPEMLDGEARIVHRDGQRVVTLSADLLFNRDSAELTEGARQTLMAFSRIIRDIDVPIAIEGHTDNRPPSTEGVEDNWDVSMDRSLAVLEFFVSEGSLEPQRLTPYAYGGAKPMVANNSPANRAKNNRVDLVLDFEHTKSGALRGLVSGDKSFDFQGFDFKLPQGPGDESEVY
ncbi:MAG: OmpA family protein [Deltaproteobacteria bacterium]|jgi:chemotaxis protein MotB|nr:OmpA family protein [Deltaproteobacteria bacterium]